MECVQRGNTSTIAPGVLVLFILLNYRIWMATMSQETRTMAAAATEPKRESTSTQPTVDPAAALAEEADVRAIYASYNQVPFSDAIGSSMATPPQPEDGETEDDLYADVDADRNGIMFVPPKMSLEAALELQQSRVAAARAARQPDPLPPQLRPAAFEPEWVQSFMPLVIETGLTIAPPDYPVLAAWTTRPSMGLAFVPADSNSISQPLQQQ